MAYILNNKYAKNLCKRTVLVLLIIENVVTCFLRHSVEAICDVITSTASSHFAARCYASAAYVVIRCPSVCLCVRHVRTFCQNE